MEYKITQERAEFLVEHFFEFSFGDEADSPPNQQAFNTINNPLELHFIADNYNWDDGVELLDWIINSPLCDKATAMMLFWRAQPDYYTEYATKEEANYDGDIWMLLQRIIQNVEKGFYTHQQLEYDSRKDPAAEKIDMDNPNSKWKIPDYMKVALKGTNVNEFYESHYPA
ncbi:MAG: DUF4274 domain-containing protein [Flavipsychrobacter sp.]|nr:DUF4274 domain-containing protein [Flavipsychrobacter sp.]